MLISRYLDIKGLLRQLTKRNVKISLRCPLFFTGNDPIWLLRSIRANGVADVRSTANGLRNTKATTRLGSEFNARPHVLKVASATEVSTLIKALTPSQISSRPSGVDLKRKESANWTKDGLSL